MTYFGIICLVNGFLNGLRGRGRRSARFISDPNLLFFLISSLQKHRGDLRSTGKKVGTSYIAWIYKIHNQFWIYAVLKCFQVGGSHFPLYKPGKQEEGQGSGALAGLFTT